MNKHILFTLLFTFLMAGRAQAQAPFAAMDSININNINALQLVHGDMWWNPATGAAHCNFPADSNRTLSHAASLWMSGYDAGGHLHVAAQTYRQAGNDYWPGPIVGNAPVSYETSEKWAKIWKVERSDIQNFMALPGHTIGNTPESILTWPGRRNGYARGNNNEPLAINEALAPFVDLNGDGKYQPLLGEYPDIKGDQALWWVFNDNGPAHTQTNGNPLGVEVQAMAYGYKRGTLIDNVVYYEYTATNYSANNYNNFRMAMWDDVSFGNFVNTYIGFDSVHRMGIVYKATNDDGASGGHPANHYIDQRSMGITMIELPGDAVNSYVPAGSFIYYNNDASIIGNPMIDTEYNNNLRAKFRGGEHIRNDFAGYGLPGSGLGAGPLCNYVYTGDPSDTSQWSECAMNNNLSEHRTVLASNGFSLNTGESKKMAWALVAVDSAGACGSASFSKIKTVADTAWYIYHNPLPVGIDKLPEGNTGIYPNPAHDKLYIPFPAGSIVPQQLAVVNMLGQMIAIPFNKQESTLDISKLSKGVYHLLYTTDNKPRRATFLKQ